MAVITWLLLTLLTVHTVTGSRQRETLQSLLENWGQTRLARDKFILGLRNNLFPL